MHGGNQPTDISLIHRRSSRLVPHHPRPLANEFKISLTIATISVRRPKPVIRLSRLGAEYLTFTSSSSDPALPNGQEPHLRKRGACLAALALRSSHSVGAEPEMSQRADARQRHLACPEGPDIGH